MGARSEDITTIFVEHDMEVVQRYGRRVLAFDGGAPCLSKSKLDNSQS